MPPPTPQLLQGRTCGVSRDGGRARALQRNPSSRRATNADEAMRHTLKAGHGMREDSISHEHMHALRHKSSATQSTDQSTAICRLIVLCTRSCTSH
ncbi:hypothetical protein EIQ06_18730 [Xanthomonas campestris pv. campestris]|nr:hypothetical protein DFG55_11930 [Xanthomonas campestris pv. campestris]QCX72469.1 hypothetical protein DFG54_18490 [Xanthomonas campestris pv. campestris]